MTAQVVPGYSSVLKPFPHLPVQLPTTTPRNSKHLTLKPHPDPALPLLMSQEDLHHVGHVHIVILQHTAGPQGLCLLTTV